jgi:hypothetical protein
MANNKVSVGITSIIGWVTSLLALLPTIVISLEEGQATLAGPEKYLAIMGIATGLITQVGRYLQAHKLIGSGEELPLIPAAVAPIGKIGPPESVQPVITNG